MRTRTLLLPAALFILAGASCTPRDLAPPGPSPAGLAVRGIRIGGHPLTVEVADTPASRATGLMNRKAMPEDQGMIFVFPAVETQSFWMKNTLIPLSIAFVDASGTIVQIEDMRPLDLTSHSSSAAVKFAIEVNQGWFARRSIGPGDRINGLDGLEAAR